MTERSSFLFVNGSLGRGNSVSKGIQTWTVLECLLSYLPGSEAVRNGMKAGGACALKKSARRGCDHEGSVLPRPFVLDSV